MVMKAIGYTGGKSLDDSDAFVTFASDKPVPGAKDLLVKIEAISVNPIDYKVRSATTEPQDPPRILGWDAAGVIEATGRDVTLFQPGDRVYYAGDLTRPGSNASHQLVDERIVGHHPKNLDFARAAALPLTAITAWEALFSRLGIDPERDRGKHILLIGGAGGVGSIAIQLAKRVAGLEVTATASRDASRTWCQSLGADHCLNHFGDMEGELAEKNIDQPHYIFCLNDTDLHFPAMARLIAPQGMICSVVGTSEKHNLDLLKEKSAGFVWEFMFTRPMYQTPDMMRQHELLNDIAGLVDAGKIKTTFKEKLGTISAENIREAHRLLETGRTIGKIVLEDFDE
jgi:alcohol dehydrogenase